MNCNILLSRLPVKTTNNVLNIHDSLYSDQYAQDQNFINLVKTIKTPCSWEKSFLYIKENNLIDKYRYFWFIEDDVYIPDIQLLNIFSEYNADLITDMLPGIVADTKKRWIGWPQISNDIKYFESKDSLYRTFNPLCRLSVELVKKILEFQTQHQTLIFHEILFASLAHYHHLSIKLYKDICSYKDLFGKYQHRPLVNKIKIDKTKINHPVKDL